MGIARADHIFSLFLELDSLSDREAHYITADTQNSYHLEDVKSLSKASREPLSEARAFASADLIND